MDANPVDTFEEDMTQLLQHLLSDDANKVVPNIIFEHREKDGAGYTCIRTFLLPTEAELGIVDDFKDMHDPNSYVFTEVTMGLRVAIQEAKAYLKQVEARLVPGQVDE